MKSTIKRPKTFLIKNYNTPHRLFLEFIVAESDSCCSKYCPTKASMFLRAEILKKKKNREVIQFFGINEYWDNVQYPPTLYYNNTSH